jgi:hypothetical protein
MQDAGGRVDPRSRLGLLGRGAGGRVTVDLRAEHRPFRRDGIDAEAVERGRQLAGGQERGELSEQDERA